MIRSRLCALRLLVAGALLLVSACDSSSSTRGVGTQPTNQGTVRPPTARERAQIAASVKDLWLYESRRPNTIDDFFRGVPRRPALRPVVVKARVLRTDRHYASAVVVLRDAHGRMHDTPWLVVLHGGDRYTPGGWDPIAGPALDFPLSCKSTTPKPLRALMCPNPWSVVGYPRPHVHEQTALTQPIETADLHRIDWRKVVLPGGACGSSQPIRPRRGYGGAATAFVHADVNLPWWNPVVVSSWGRPVFGDLDGDGRDEAALHVTCANGGGMAAGQLQFSDAIFKAVGKSLRVIGIVTPRQPLDPRAGHVPLEFVHRIERGQLIAREAWYGPFDGTCCASGDVETTWSFRHSKLVPSRIRVIRPIWTSPVLVQDVLGEPGDHELVEEAIDVVGPKRIEVPVTTALRFDVWVLNEGTETKRNVKVTLTIAQPRGPVVRTLMIRRIAPWAVDDTILHFGNLDAVRPGKTSIVIRIGLPGATPLRYPVTFTRG